MDKSAEVPDPQQAAKKRRFDRAQVEKSLLDAGDYAYFVVYVKAEPGNDRRIEKSVRAPSLKDAKDFSKKLSGRIERRIKKSGCRKLADYYGLSLPENPIPQSVEVVQIGGFVFQKERGAGFSAVKVMAAAAAQLSLVKAEYTVAVKAPDGRVHAGVGACSITEGRGFSHPDHDIPATAWTRAYNRAIMDSIGWGSVTAEESETPAAAADAPAKPGPEAGGAAAVKPDDKRPPQIPAAKNEVPIQKSQSDTVKFLAQQIGLTEQALDQASVARHKRAVKDLSRQQAVEFINHLLVLRKQKQQAA